jgi:hypothetical protein
MSTKKRATLPQEEDIEFSNVTKFRTSLLGAVERMQSNPAKRYIITKHGEPEAVLMSYPTYSLLTKVMDRELEGTDGQSREEAIRAAFARLRNDRRPAAANREEVALTLEEPATRAEPSSVEAEAYPALVSGESRESLPRNDVLDIVQEIRRHIEELDYALKKQGEEEQSAGSSLMSEK